jgi:tRNA modification GTPase
VIRNDICQRKYWCQKVENKLLSFVNTGALRNNETIVTNTRHYDSLLKALEEVTKEKYGLETNLPAT